LSDAQPGFGDNVRIRVTPETEAAGVASVPLLLRLPRVLGVIMPAAVYNGLLWFMFRSPRKS